ncbi:MAG: hypothetical protein ACK6BC_11080, partial [Cyanobacteriota bacterium]
LDFKSLDEVEEEGQADSIFEDVERYLALNQKAHRRYRHGLHLITNEEEKIRSLRGLVCQEAVRILNTTEKSPELDFLKKYLPYLEIPNNSTTRELRLKFEGVELEEPVVLPIDVSLQDPLEESIRSITICTPRQRCVATKEIPYLEVRIPIHFSAVSDSKLAKDMIGDFLHRVDSFEVYRQLPNEKEPTLLADNVQLSFREVREVREVCESSVEEFLILDPYLLTDRLDLEWDSEFTRLKFKDPRLMTSAMPEVVYDVRVKPLAQSKPGSKGTSICLGIHRIPLQVLQPAPSLTDLVASIQVSSLCSDSPLNDLKIGRLKAEKFECLNSNDPIFQCPDSHDEQPNELEIWLEESLIEAVGFFGEPIVLRDPQKPESLDELKTRPPQTRHGKVLVGRWKEDWIPLNDKMFRLKPGYTYHIFVGHRSSGSWHGLLTELPCALLGKKNQDEMQFSSSIEVISSEKEPRYLSVNEFEIQKVSWTRNLLQLRIHPVQCGLLGGFEVNIRDQHERHLNISLEREVISHRYFLCSEMDYRNDSRWEFASPPEKDETVNTKDYDLAKFYQDNDNNERTQLIQKAEILKPLIDRENTPWTELYQEAQEFWSSVWAYQRTGAYVNSRDRWEELKMRFRFLFTGLLPPESIPPQSITMGSLSERWSECSKALLEVENTDLDALVADGGEEGTQSLADFETAARMTAIIRHCQEITEEIFGNTAPDVPVLPGDEMSVLPGEVVWPSQLTDKQKDGKLTKKLIDLFGQPRNRSSTLLEHLLAAKDLEEEILDDPKDIQACVTHSTALVKLINALKGHLQGKQWELVKR